jgi:hypothetical protein
MEATKGREIATAARRMVEGARLTAYEHGITVDPSAGTYFTDCSGFVSYVLERVAPEHYGAIPREVAHAYPRAFEFFDYFVSRAAQASFGWRRVDRFVDAREGDVVAWREQRVRDDQDSGHIFVVAQAPIPIGDGFWLVGVYDSSDIPHFDDSRERGSEFRSGVGMGGILIRVDAEGRAIGFIFGSGDSLHDLPIVVARLEPLAPRS